MVSIVNGVVIQLVLVAGNMSGMCKLSSTNIITKGPACLKGQCTDVPELWFT